MADDNIPTNEPPIIENKPTIVTDDKYKFSSMIQDNGGGVSSMRVLMLLWGIIPLLIWTTGAIVALYHGIYVFPSISPEVVTVMLGLTGAKVVQRFGEK